MYLERSGGVGGIEVKCLVKTDSPSETPGSPPLQIKILDLIDDVQAFWRWWNIMRFKE